MTDKYTLDGKTPVPAASLEAWAEWYEDANRRVAETKTSGGTVSTVFLGLDHQFGDGPPLLFETLVFGGGRDQEGARCSTWEEAEEQHEQFVELVLREPADD